MTPRKFFDIKSISFVYTSVGISIDSKPAATSSPSRCGELEELIHSESISIKHINSNERYICIGKSIGYNLLSVEIFFVHWQSNGKERDIIHICCDASGNVVTKSSLLSNAAIKNQIYHKNGFIFFLLPANNNMSFTTMQMKSLSSIIGEESQDSSGMNKVLFD